MSATGTSVKPVRRALGDRWSVLVVVGVVILLLIGVGLTSSRGSADLPGSVGDYLSEQTTRHRVDSGAGTEVWESTLMSGMAMASSGPWWLGLSLADFEQMFEADWLRVTITRSTTAGIERELQLYLVAEDGLYLTTTANGDEVTFYRPALLVLPAEDSVSSWSGQGMAETVEGGTGTPFAAQSTMSATTVDGRSEDCLRVETVLDVATLPGPGETTWCRGSGLIPPGTSVRMSPLGPEELADPAAMDAGSWQVSEVATQLDPPMTWGTSLPPVGTSALLVVAVNPGEDLVFVPNDDPTSAWRTHPGGAITMLERHGELVVAGTSRSELVAYDTDGLWRWTTALPDIPSYRGASAGQALRVVDGAAGVSSIDLGTGELQWRTVLDDPIGTAPVTCGEATYVGTTGSQVVAIDGGGEPLWQVELADPAQVLACVPGGVVAVSAGTIDHISASGQWLASVPSRDGAIDTAQMVGEVLVTTSGTLVTGYTPGSLAVHWRHERTCLQMFVVAETLICTSDGLVAMLDSGGTTISVNTVASIPETIDTWTRTETGMLRFSQAFTVTRLQ
ncbi:MAG: PQQ-binding-like beta-propeller repeat protein [Beutenbergiaceae bacterium]